MVVIAFYVKLIFTWKYSSKLFYFNMLVDGQKYFEVLRYKIAEVKFVVTVITNCVNIL